MSDPETELLVCPQCAMEVKGLDRCPECGAPCVPQSALRLSPGPEGDEVSYGEVVQLRDPFEGQHLVALLESRRIPVMIRGGSDSALAAGWVDHSGRRFGVLMAPEGRLAEARDLVEQFRIEADRSESLGDEELAAIAEQAALEPEVADGRPGEARSSRLKVGRGGLVTAFRLILGFFGLVGTVVALRYRQMLLVAVLLGWSYFLLKTIGSTLVLDARRRVVTVTTVPRLLLGRKPLERSWESIDRVSVRRVFGGHRVLLTGPGVEIHGPIQRDERQAKKKAREAAIFLGLRGERDDDSSISGDTSVGDTDAD